MARLLLDENVPRLFGRVLTGHDVRTVRQMGWAGLKNGTLLRRAAADFDVFLTLDRSIPFQQSVTGLQLAVIVVRVRSNRLDSLEELAPSVLGALDTCAAGTATSVGDWPPDRS